MVAVTVAELARGPVPALPRVIEEAASLTKTLELELKNRLAAFVMMLAFELPILANALVRST